nr:4'-phosphopantetheinyl transferase superfamily protein [Myxacorys almedinensis]
MQFNVAHSQDRALYILSRDASELGRANRTVGIDIEQIRNVDRLEALTRRFFSAIEHAAICDAEAHQRSRLFFRYWTCKEAYLKATGDGLGKLGDLEISLSVEQSARFQRLPANESTQQWYLQELELDSDFVGALSARYSPTCSSSAESPEPSFRVHQFTFDPQ